LHDGDQGGHVISLRARWIVASRLGRQSQKGAAVEHLRTRQTASDPEVREPNPSIVAVPTAGRRAALRLAGLGLALLASLGLSTSTSASQSADAAALPLPPPLLWRRGKRGRKGRNGNHWPPGPVGEPGSGGLPGLQGPAGPSSGAFLGLVSGVKNVTVNAGGFEAITIDCPAANPGERLLAVGGGFDAQVFNTNGFFMTSNRPESDTRWVVGGLNTSNQTLILVGHVICARVTA